MSISLIEAFSKLLFCYHYYQNSKSFAPLIKDIFPFAIRFVSIIKHGSDKSINGQILSITFFSRTVSLSDTKYFQDFVAK